MSRVTQWRDHVRDSDLDRTAKLTAFVLSTYMNGRGECWPSKSTIARGASLGEGRRAVDAAIDRIEAAGLLKVNRKAKPFRYVAAGATPNTHGLRHQDAADATYDDEDVAPDASLSRTDVPAMSQRVRTKALKALEDVSTRADARGNGTNSRSRANEYTEYDHA